MNMADPPSQNMERGEIQYVFRIVWCSFIVIATITVLKYIHLLPEELRMLYDNSWKIKHHVQHILSRLFPKYYDQGITMETTDTVVPKVNCQSLIVIGKLLGACCTKPQLPVTNCGILLYQCKLSVTDCNLLIWASQVWLLYCT